MKKIKNKNYSEATIFAVPLKTKGYGVGLISRQFKNIVLGYFFNIKFDRVPKSDQVVGLEKKKVIWICILDDLGLQKGKWKIVGKMDDWSKQLWPIPPFVSRDALRNIINKRLYEEDLLTYGELMIEEKEGKKLFQDGLYGAGLVEDLLTDLIEGKNFNLVLGVPKD